MVKELFAFPNFDYRNKDDICIKQLQQFKKYYSNNFIFFSIIYH